MTTSTMPVGRTRTCACSHPPAPKFSDASTRLGVDTFNVIFQGNAYTPWATAESYALYRSAELTVDAGFDYFVVLGGTVDAVALRRAASNPLPPPAGLDTDRPNVAITIRAFKGATPSKEAFNAREVIAELAPSIRRP